MSLLNVVSNFFWDFLGVGPTLQVVVVVVHQDDVLDEDLRHGLEESLLEAGSDGPSLNLVHQQEVVRVVRVHVAELE